eukprot:1157449-Pelagomonas_calceolata.AAC.2
MRRYHIQDRDDYKKYNKIVGMVTKLTNVLKQLDPKDATRIELTDQLLEKLTTMGVLPAKKSLVQCEQLATSAFCRRRLSVVMVRNKMAETVREACTFIEQVGFCRPAHGALQSYVVPIGRQTLLCSQHGRVQVGPGKGRKGMEWNGKERKEKGKG